jgi:hypothetical protein
VHRASESAKVSASGDTQVDYLSGLARNERLTAQIATEIEAARIEAEASGKPARRFRDFTWSTLDSWSRMRRVVGNAELTAGEANPRFVAASLKPAHTEARHLYETIHCARREMENWIKERQVDLFARSMPSPATCGGFFSPPMPSRL